MKFDFRILFVSVVFVITALVAFVIKPTTLLADSREAFDINEAIPASFSNWSSEENMFAIVASPDLEANLAVLYDQYFDRVYKNDLGESTFLTLTYGRTQTGDQKAHRQEFCYSAQGFQIISSEIKTVEVSGNAIDVVHLVTRKGRRIELVTYWFTMGDYVAIDRLERLMVQSRYAIQGYVPDGFLVRISTIEDSVTMTDSVFAEHLVFANELFSSSTFDNRINLIGKS
jgi:EpsI family protein